MKSRIDFSSICDITIKLQMLLVTSTNFTSHGSSKTGKLRLLARSITFLGVLEI